MNIYNTLNSINGHINSAYNSLINKKVNIPNNRNAQNLAPTINNVPTGFLIFNTVEEMYNITPVIGEYALINDNNISHFYQFSLQGWQDVSAQINAKASLVWKNTFFGINGTEMGQMQSKVFTNREDFEKIRNLNYKLSKLTPNAMLTDLNGLFTNVEYTTVPQIDTSNVINLANFYKDSKIINFPNLNLTNATNLSNMYENCDISNSLNRVISDLPNYSQIQGATTNDLSYLGIINNSTLLNRQVGVDALNKGWDVSRFLPYYNYIIHYNRLEGEELTTVYLQETFDNYDFEDKGMLVRNFINSLKVNNQLVLQDLIIEGDIDKVTNLSNFMGDGLYNTYNIRNFTINTAGAVNLYGAFSSGGYIYNFTQFNFDNATNFQYLFASSGYIGQEPTTTLFLKALPNRSQIPGAPMNLHTYINKSDSFVDNVLTEDLLTYVYPKGWNVWPKIYTIWGSYTNGDNKGSQSRATLTGSYGTFGSQQIRNAIEDRLNLVKSTIEGRPERLATLNNAYNNCPLLQTFAINNSRTTDMLYNTANAFYNCQNLTTISNKINMANVKNAENMFYNCINLSNDSYNIIVNFLPNANQLTNQYISNIGLNIERFNKIQKTILYHKGYQDFEAYSSIWNIYYDEMGGVI